VATWPASFLDVAEADERLARCAAPLRAAGLDVQTVVRGGVAEDGIAAVAREAGADLIVMAPHEHSGLERLSRLLRPSVGAQMVSHTPIPLLVVPGRAHSGRAVGEFGPPDAPVMVALDGSRLAERVIPAAAAFARDFGRRLLLVRVVPVGPLGPSALARRGVMRIAAQTLIEEEREAHRYLASVRRDIVAAAPVKSQTRVVAGDPAQELLGTAAEEEAGLLALATHGRGGLARAALGSVAATLLRRTTVPLLIVPPSAPVPRRDQTPSRSEETRSIR